MCFGDPPPDALIFKAGGEVYEKLKADYDAIPPQRGES